MELSQNTLLQYVRIAACIAQNFDFCDIVSAPSLSAVGDILGGRKQGIALYLFS